MKLGLWLHFSFSLECPAFQTTQLLRSLPQSTCPGPLTHSLQSPLHSIPLPSPRGACFYSPRGQWCSCKKHPSFKGTGNFYLDGCLEPSWCPSSMERPQEGKPRCSTRQPQLSTQCQPSPISSLGSDPLGIWIFCYSPRWHHVGQNHPDEPSQFTEHEIIEWLYFEHYVLGCIFFPKAVRNALRPFMDQRDNR